METEAIPCNNHGSPSGGCLDQIIVGVYAPAISQASEIPVLKRAVLQVTQPKYDVLVRSVTYPNDQFSHRVCDQNELWWLLE